MAHQMALASKVLKSDMESDPVLAPAAGRRQRHRPDRAHHRGFAHWVGARSRPQEPARPPARAAPSPASPPACRRSSTDAFAAVAGGSQIQVTEAMLGQAMQHAYTNGAIANALDRAAGAEEHDLDLRRP